MFFLVPPFILLLNVFQPAPIQCWHPTPTTIFCGPGENEMEVVLDAEGRRMPRPRLSEDDK